MHICSKAILQSLRRSGCCASSSVCEALLLSPLSLLSLVSRSRSRSLSCLSPIACCPCMSLLEKSGVIIVTQKGGRTLYICIVPLKTYLGDGWILGELSLSLSHSLTLSLSLSSSRIAPPLLPALYNTVAAVLY
jgi:hypothetical protein